jgi:hypothetical protein
MVRRIGHGRFFSIRDSSVILPFDAIQSRYWQFRKRTSKKNRNNCAAAYILMNCFKVPYRNAKFKRRPIKLIMWSQGSIPVSGGVQIYKKWKNNVRLSIYLPVWICSTVLNKQMTSQVYSFTEIWISNNTNLPSNVSFIKGGLHEFSITK